MTLRSSEHISFKECVMYYNAAYKREMENKLHNISTYIEDFIYGLVSAKYYILHEIVA